MREPSASPIKSGRHEGCRSLVIDNWDSFTANVCGLIQKQTDVAPRLVSNTTSPDDLELLIKTYQPDFVVLAPGPGNPLNAADFGVNRYVLSDVCLPVLGICLGMQGVAAHHGAHIDRVANPVHGFPRPVYHNGSHPLFKDIPSPFTVVCYNSLCASRCPSGLEAISWTADGVVMGVDAVGSRNQAQIGVQFHPESYLTEFGDVLIRNFLNTYVTSNGSGPALSSPTDMPAPCGGHQFHLEYRCVKLHDAFSVEALITGLNSRLPRGSDCIWFDSSDGGRFSYLSVRTSHRIGFDGASRRVVDSNRGIDTLGQSQTFFDYLKARMASYSLTIDGDRNQKRLPFDFAGGYCGYLSYESKSVLVASITSAPSYPAATFAFVDQFIALDHDSNSAYIVILCDAASRERDPDAVFSEQESMIQSSVTGRIHVHRNQSTNGGDSIQFVCRDSKKSYEDKVARCLDYIADGHSYELCLTTQHVSDGIVAEPLSLYFDLRGSNPAPFAAFLQFEDVSICSCSPERFLKLDRCSKVLSQPIKGTVRRGSSHSEDSVLQQQLENSVKDRAENLMITDLVRHDLARCCVAGSVEVERFCELQRFRHVFQLTSTIGGRLSPLQTAVDCIQAAFPPGSMTGAPKKRSVEILEEIERAPRGIYSGCLGFLSINGCADFSVVIRTVVCTSSSTSIGSGGAIVSLSEAGLEHSEMLLKARAPIRDARMHLTMK